MKSFILAALVATITANAGPVTYPFYQRRADNSPFGVSFSSIGDGSKDGILNHEDLFYFIDIKVCGQNFSVQLDTGSSDLFIYHPQQQLPGVKVYDLPVVLGYGDGSGVKGNAAVCPVEFSHYSVINQTFLDASFYNDTTGLFISSNVLGLMGLGFDSNSRIYRAVASAGVATPSGLTLLSNLFLQSPATPNFIAFLFDRASEIGAPPQGSFTVGENHPGYESILNEPALPVIPEDGTEWTTVLDSVDVNGQLVPLKSIVTGVPAGKTIALLDTGTSLIKAPKVVVDAVYSPIPGSLYLSDVDLWLVPCLGESDVGLTFAGNRYAIHPLDLSSVKTTKLDNGTSVTFCLSTIRDIGTGGGYRLDWILGDSFLRNVYSLYDFGDTDAQGNLISKAYMKLYNLTQPAQASSDFKTQRAKALSSLPPAVDPKDLVNLLSSQSSSTQSVAPPQPTGGIGKPTPQSLANDAADVTPDTSAAWADLQTRLDKALSYIPYILGLLGANLLILLVLVIVGWALYPKRRKSRAYAPITH